MTALGQLSTTVNFLITSVKRGILDSNLFCYFPIRMTASQSMLCVQKQVTFPHPDSSTQASLRAPKFMATSQYGCKDQQSSFRPGDLPGASCSKHLVNVTCIICDHWLKIAVGCWLLSVPENHCHSDEQAASEKIWPTAHTFPAAFNFSFLGIEAGRMGKNVTWQITFPPLVLFYYYFSLRHNIKKNSENYFLRLLSSNY